jgi:enoyl-CoA hydratase/carnithine racemase
MACDFRVAADSIRIGWPEIHVGFVAPTGRLARFVGIGRAKDLLLNGRLLKAPQAAELGLLTTVVPATEVDRALAAMTAQLAGRPPVAVRLTKASLEWAYSFPVDNPALEVDAAAESYATADLREGAAAILEKRAPHFTGS